MVLAETDIQIGATIEMTGGHHPGSICRIVNVSGNYVQYLGKRNGTNGGLLARKPIRVRRDVLMAHANLVSPPKEQRRAERMVVSDRQDQLQPGTPSWLRAIPAEEAPPAPGAAPQASTEAPEPEAPSVATSVAAFPVPDPEFVPWEASSFEERERLANSTSLARSISDLNRWHITPERLQAAITGWGPGFVYRKLGWVNADRLRAVAELWGLSTGGKGHQATHSVAPEIEKFFPNPDIKYERPKVGRQSSKYGQVTSRFTTPQPSVAPSVASRPAPVAPPATMPNGTNPVLVALQSVREQRAQVMARESALRAELAQVVSDRLVFDQMIESMRQRIGNSPGEIQDALKEMAQDGRP